MHRHTEYLYDHGEPTACDHREQPYDLSFTNRYINSIGRNNLYLVQRCYRQPDHRFTCGDHFLYRYRNYGRMLRHGSSYRNSWRIDKRYGELTDHLCRTNS